MTGVDDVDAAICSYVIVAGIGNADNGTKVLITLY